MKAHKIEEDSMSSHERTGERITRLETIIENINNTLVSLHQENQSIDAKNKILLESMTKEMRMITDGMQKGFEKVYEKMDKRFERIESRIEANRAESWSQFRWILGTVLVSVGGILANVLVKNLPT